MSSLIEDYFLDDIEKKRFYFDQWNQKHENITAGSMIQCRVNYSKKMIKDEKGNDVMSTAMVQMGFDEDILFNDELKIDGKFYTVKRIDLGRSFEGVHKEVYV
ncbi:MAG TPA: hypothetical protein VGB37_15590 [Candidatus Lokiarchaeia archaeon]